MRIDEIILLEISKRVREQMRNKWKKADPNLTDDMVNYYLDRWDRFSGSFPKDRRDIMRLSFDEVEQLIDSAEGKQMAKGRGKSAQVDIKEGPIYDKNNLFIYKGDSKEKCIQYGKGYTWCISRADSSNLYNRYRFSGYEPMFYFVFDKDLSEKDPLHAVVIHVDRNGEYKITTSMNDGDDDTSWEEITQMIPKLKPLKSLFVSQPLTDEERDDYKKYGSKVTNEKFIEFTDQEKAKYIEHGNEIPLELQSELPDHLLVMYSKQNPSELSIDSWNRLRTGDARYAVSQIKALIDHDLSYVSGLPDVHKLTNTDIRNEVIEVATRSLKVAYRYALYVIKGEFPEGEAVIAQNTLHAYYYARDIIKGEFPAGEAVIAQDPQYAYKYATGIIKRRFPAGEAAIAQDPQYSYNYARDIKGEFPAGEAAIAQDASIAYYYARDIKGEFPAGEAAIAQDPQYAYYYAKDIIQGRFPEGEAAIARWPIVFNQYKVTMKELGDPVEEEEEVAESSELNRIKILAGLR